MFVLPKIYLAEVEPVWVAGSCQCACYKYYSIPCFFTVMQEGQANKDQVSYFHPFINPFFLTLSPALRVAEQQESIPTNLCI